MTSYEAALKQLAIHPAVAVALLTAADRVAAEDFEPLEAFEADPALLRDFRDLERRLPSVMFTTVPSPERTALLRAVARLGAALTERQVRRAYGRARRSGGAASPR